MAKFQSSTIKAFPVSHPVSHPVSPLPPPPPPSHPPPSQAYSPHGHLATQPAPSAAALRPARSRSASSTLIPGAKPGGASRSTRSQPRQPATTSPPVISVEEEVVEVVRVGLTTTVPHHSRSREACGACSM